MAFAVQIQCIRKTDRFNPHERIHAVGGLNPNGSRWHLPLDKAIAGVEAGEWVFYVNVYGKRVDVEVVTVLRGGVYHKYLKTVNDGEQPNNLLSLPECPPA